MSTSPLTSRPAPPILLLLPITRLTPGPVGAVGWVVTKQAVGRGSREVVQQPREARASVDWSWRPRSYEYLGWEALVNTGCRDRVLPPQGTKRSPSPPSFVSKTVSGGDHTMERTTSPANQRCPVRIPTVRHVTVARVVFLPTRGAPLCGPGTRRGGRWTAPPACYSPGQLHARRFIVGGSATDGRFLCNGISGTPHYRRRQRNADPA